MKQVDIKKPKYVIPALALPFVLFIGWMVKDMMNFEGKKEGVELAVTEDVNIDIPDANLEKRETKSKFEALKGAFNKSSDFSSIQTIDKEEAISEVEDPGSLYTSDEMRSIDSLNRASRQREAEIAAMQQSYDKAEKINPLDGDPDRAGTRTAPRNSKQLDEMELFKMQMAYMDSLQNPQKYAQPVKQVKTKIEEEAVEVIKAANPAANYFNTVGQEHRSNQITAIVDENLKVTDGSRIRIRLLDDIKINDMLITKGAYLYGNVTGFRAQRVSITISSIMVNAKQVKVDLSVYDVDGQEGFYVPASAFRELTKNIGSQVGSQSISIQDNNGGLEQFALGALQDAYRSTTQAITKNIKKNKARIKYNSQVYLVNNKEKNN